MSDPTKAVFLSYAREDAEHARRIADALRAFGIEVWFDQNELRGGDAWDAKIRKQIRDSALFIPVVSARTQARAEGYFRREWKLAVERTSDMAASRTFLLPVVVDDTPEAEAEVPEEFLRVQWTRLANGEPTPEFVAQVKRLLEAPRKPAPKPDLPRPLPLPPELLQAAGGRAAAEAATAKGESGFPGWKWGALTAVVVGIAVALYVSRKPRTAPPPVAAVPLLAPAAPNPTAASAQPPLEFASAKSIAVLPFANLSAEKENEFFADGMHDDLITAIAKVRDLKVISRTSVLPYRTGERNLRQIAAELGVAHVLEGSVQRAGNRVRINLQLIDARTDAHLWAETFNRELTDIFALQAELVQQVASVLKATLTGAESELLARRPTENQRAYELYLRARVLGENLANNAPQRDYEQLIAMYEEAVREDPGFVLAHVQASILHGTLYWFSFYDSTPARLEKTRAAMERARALAPVAPETLLAEGSFEYTCKNDWRTALGKYEQAEKGLPNDSQLQYRIGIAHRRLGDTEEALRRLERGIALNPNDRMATVSRFECLLHLRRYRQVLAEIGQAERKFTDLVLASIRLGAKLGEDGDWSAFMEAHDRLPAVEIERGRWLRSYISALGRGGLAEAERLLAELPGQFMPGDSFELVAQHRALNAWLQGRVEDASRLAGEALEQGSRISVMPRRQAELRLAMAEALALTGRHEEARRTGLMAARTLEATDAFNYRSSGIGRLGRIQLICGEREAALQTLREWVAGPGVHPAQIRHDLFWSRLKDDPRFEEILRSAKPL